MKTNKKLKSVIKKIAALVLGVCLFVGCNMTPEDDGTTPPPLFPQPKTIAANPQDGYVINIVTGDSIKPIVNSKGDTIITGVPFKIIGKEMHPDSVGSPKPIKLNISTTPGIVDPNIHPISEPVNTISIDLTNLKKDTIPKVLPGDTSHYLVFRPGDTILTGQPISVKPKESIAISSKLVRSQLPKIKDNAIADIQILDKDLGMANNGINSLLHDREGQLWIGSIDGILSKFDGTYFQHFKRQKRNQVEMIYSLLEDSKGNIWQSIYQGISRFDGQKFTEFTWEHGVPIHRAFNMIVDRYDNIWIPTRGYGLACLRMEEDGTKGHFTFYTENEGLPSNYITSLLEDQSGRIWVGTGTGGIAIIEPGKDIQPQNPSADTLSTLSVFNRQDGLTTNRIYSIFEDSEGKIWIGTFEGLNLYRPSKGGQPGTVEHYTEKNGLSNNFVGGIIEDDDGNIWINTMRGLNRWVKNENITRGYFEHYTKQEGLSDNEIRSIVKGNDGILWIGTFSGGLNRLDVNSFRPFLSGYEVSTTFFAPLLEDSKGNFWYSQEYAVVRYTPPSNNKPAVFTTFTNNEILYPRGTGCIFEDSKGCIWIEAKNGPICFDPSMEGKWDAFTQFTKNEGLSSDRVGSFYEDKKGQLWFGNWDGGVTRYVPDASGGRFTHFSTAEGFPGATVRSILEDKNGIFWFGTDYGICRFELDNDGISAILTIISEKEGLSNNFVLTSLEDKDGFLWFGTAFGGLNRFDGKNFTYFTEAEGLSHNSISGLIEDPNGTLWVNTQNRISYILSKKSTEKGSSDNQIEFNYLVGKFAKNDGLNNLIFNGRYPLLDSKGRLLWTHRNGITMLDVNKYKLNEALPKMQMREVAINEEIRNLRGEKFKNESGIKFGKVQDFENYPVNLILPHKLNHLTFFFSALEWKSPHQLLYSHRVLGLDKSWSAPSPDAKADYRNLPPGKFVLQVRAIGQSQVWSEPFAYSFTILPPWWKTWWAYFGYLFIFLGALRTFSHWREKKLYKEKELLRLKVNERTSELKESLDNLKSTQAQLIHAEKMASLGELTAGIAHEIQNPLNFVNNFSEVSGELIDEMHEEIERGDLNEVRAISMDIKENLGKINHHGKRADSIIKGMLQHSRSSSGQKEPTDINVLCDEYLRLAYHGLRAKDKSFNAGFETHFDTDMPKVEVVPQDIGRVLLNLINNAFYVVDRRSKNQSALDSGYKPTVTVTTKNLNDKIEISVIDNGGGIPEEIKDKIFQPFFTTKPTGQGTGLGLSLAYDIMKAHGGIIEIESKVGEGTKFILTLSV